ncbi:trehalose-6-phosphate synthase [Xanthobacteraceae bacterium Astr-EGSB]|uniref:alpha,alpha-trehalose-phosphate synthase (UDP-forming) n=1 Tax=Astrobacterium formosum TaxID=3069710 RepID=UPI0027B1F578|nr:trehalose-6-phosphate synthase [Xanthobacteraceae bacterium Astr-EGSB]
MKNILRKSWLGYIGLGIAGTALIIVAVMPLTSAIVEGWLNSDVELRARLVFRSIRDQVIVGLAAAPAVDLVPFFERLTEDERILALGYCTAAGELRYATKFMPKTISCAKLERGKVDTSATVTDGDRPTHISVFPITAGPVSGHLLLLHDLQFVTRRVHEVRLYTALGLIGVALGLGLLAAVITRTLLRHWSLSVRSAIADVRRGAIPDPYRDRPTAIGSEIHALLSEFRVDRRYVDGIHVEWSPKTLHRLLEEELPGVEILVVSNREPYIHNKTDGGVLLQTPASGLVAAIEPVMRACGGTWIAHGSGSADRQTVDENDRIAVPPDAPAYTLRRVWLSAEEQNGYYYGLSNEGLWPLCHVAFVRPAFREEDWIQYQAVNERFADAVVQEAKQDDPIVLVQDYHFALLPRMIRQRLPKATIITFWHIPWANSETFGIFPWREQLIDGLLGSTILGFHTRFHCNNFIEAIDRFMESRIDRETATVTFRGHDTMIRAYPISIEWPPAALAEQRPVRECRDAVRQRFSLPPDTRIAVGIERFDYTKGIIDRIRAIDDLLTWKPQWRGKFVFIQAAAPTRGELEAYSTLQAEAMHLAEEVNARHSVDGFAPIRLVVRHHEPREVYELFRAADVCVVSSLHDGMNLVAKEFVASRDDEQGVLVLSSFAGASRELSEALIINPYHTRNMAKAILTALSMPAGEQRQRMRLMRSLVQERNVHRWAAQMLLDASRLRKRERVLGTG